MGVDQKLLDLLHQTEAVAHAVGWDQPPQLYWVVAAPEGLGLGAVLLADPGAWNHPRGATPILRLIRKHAAANPPPHPVVGVIFVMEAWSVPVPEDPAARAAQDRMARRRQLDTDPNRASIRLAYLVTRPGVVTALVRPQDIDAEPQTHKSAGGDIPAALIELLTLLPTGN